MPPADALVPALRRGSRAAMSWTPERVLVVVLLCELLFFSLAGTNFLTLRNAAEVARASVEIGLLALGLTIVILSGGIDLSCGSLLGLAAVAFGAAWRDGGLPVPAAVLVALATGVGGGVLNGLLIARGGVPPLIVTLGTYSLFRGLAEGATGGAGNYTGFPDGLLRLGQGQIAGVPSQLWILVLAAAAFAVLVHAGVFGRTIRAIGFSPEGSRHAGIPVSARLQVVYILSGLMAGVAAVVYVARLGQAKADAGTGFELTAITAVVLGGTSIFGGRGSVGGTLLGVAVLAILQNGLRLSDQPAELAGVLTGVLLLVAIGIGARPRA